MKFFEASSRKIYFRTCSVRLQIGISKSPTGPLSQGKEMTQRFCWVYLQKYKFCGVFLICLRALYDFLKISFEDSVPKMGIRAKPKQAASWVRDRGMVWNIGFRAGT